MDNKVSQEMQDNIKAGLVRTQMDNAVSKETQGSIKSALSAKRFGGMSNMEANLMSRFTK